MKWQRVRSHLRRLQQRRAIAEGDNNRIEDVPKKRKSEVDCDRMNWELIHRAVSRLLIAASLAVPAAALAQPLEGNPLIGRQTATALCVPCHQIGQTRHDGAPSFVDVANMPSTTALSLKVFLRSNHKEMPNLIISNSDTDDLIAYILNLKQPSAPKRP